MILLEAKEIRKVAETNAMPCIELPNKTACREVLDAILSCKAKQTLL